MRAFLESETQRGLRPTAPGQEETQEPVHGQTEIVEGLATVAPETGADESADKENTVSFWASTRAFFAGLLPFLRKKEETATAETNDDEVDAQEEFAAEVDTVETAEHDADPAPESNAVDDSVRILTEQAEALKDELAAVKASLEAELGNSSSLTGQMNQYLQELQMSSSQIVALQGDLAQAVNRAIALEEQEKKLQNELVLARKRIAAEVRGGKALKSENSRLRSHFANTQADLNSMAFKLEAEKAASQEKDEAIAALKSELDHSITTFEEEQDKSKRLNMKMIRMQRALSNVQCEKDKLGARVEVLSDRIKNAESRVSVICVSAMHGSFS